MRFNGIQGKQLLASLVLLVSFVILGNQEVALLVHTVLDLGDSQQSDSDDGNTDVAQVLHDNGHQRPHGCPVEHAQVAAVSSHAAPAGDQSRTEDLDQTGDEGDDQASLQAALFVGNQTDGSVVEEDGNEAADDDGGATNQDQGDDSQQLADQTCQEAEGDSVCIAEAIADSAVNTGDGGGQQLVSDTLEGSSQLGNEGTDTQLQDCQVNGKVQGLVQDVPCEVGALSGSAGLNEVGLADDQHDGAEEDGHQDSGTNHVLVEDGEEAGHLQLADLLDLTGDVAVLVLLLTEELVSCPVAQTDTEHLLVSNSEAGAIGQLLHGLNSQVGADSPVSAQNDSHADQHDDIVVQQSGNSEHNQPECGGSLLHLDVASGEQGTALGDLVETDQQDVNDKGDQQQDQQKPQQSQGEQPKITPQAAQQMLQAIQAKEKETQDKVNEQKAKALKSRQKEKNW